MFSLFHYAFQAQMQIIDRYIFRQMLIANDLYRCDFGCPCLVDPVFALSELVRVLGRRG